MKHRDRTQLPTDEQLIALYFARDEQAITQTDRKYGRMLYALALRILHDAQDCEECQNDTYLHTWNAIPPERPSSLGAFLSRIMRRVSIDRYRERTRQKRGGAAEVLPLDELAEMIPDTRSVEEAYAAAELARLINGWLGTLGERERYIFIGRFFMNETLSTLAKELGVHTSTVHRELDRLKGDLKEILERNGVSL